MRKVFLMVVAIILCLSVKAYADIGESYKYVYSYRLTNASGHSQVSVVDTTHIRPNVDKIVGWDIRPFSNASAELTIGLFDGTDALLDGECLQEAEAENNSSKEAFWPTPKRILEGLVVNQGPNTEVNIYYVRE
ncbi:MAG: hypothetical protein WC810_03015 [Janthinobacterium sp.]|jgi:hypothetical protein